MVEDTGGTVDPNEDEDDINYPIDFDLIDYMMEPAPPKLTKGQRKVLMQRLRHGRING